MRKDLKIAATQAALDQGFSSLQEAVRVFLKKLASQLVTVTFTEEERLSPRAEKRYAKMIADIKAGKNITRTNSLEELFAKLHEN